MLIADVISRDFTLNDFEVIGSLSFIPGENTTLAIRLKQSDRPDLLRYIPPSTAVLTIHMNNIDGTQTDLVMTALTDDRSIWSGAITQAMSSVLAGGNITFDLDVLNDGTNIIKGWIQNALSLIVTGVC